MRRGLIVMATCLGFAIVQLDVSVVNVALGSIATEFAGSISLLQWTVSAYTIVFASLILSAGALGDRWGARRIFVGGFVIFAVASVGCGLSPTIGVLVGARAVQGIGAAALVPSSLSMLSQTYREPGRRAKAIGIWTASASAALAGGPLIGGALIALFGWRSIFFINVPLAALGTVVILLLAQETSRTPGRRGDPAGQSTAIAMLVVAVWAIIESGESGLTNPVVLAALALSAGLGAAFVLIEKRARRPMLPLSLFRSPGFSVSIIIGLLLNAVFYGLVFVFSLYFQRTQGYTPVQTGLAFVPMTGSIMITNATAAPLAQRFGSSRVIAVAAAIMAAAAIALMGTTRGTTYGAIVIQLFALGIGLGAIVPLLTASVLSSVHPTQSGIGSGALNSARQVGSALGVAVFGSLAGGTAIVGGMHVSVAITVVLSAAIVGLALTLDRLRDPREGALGAAD